MEGWPGAGDREGLLGVAAGERSSQLRLLARRVGHCINDTDRILAGLRHIQLLDWQSPAGRAYRNSVGKQREALELARYTLQIAEDAVTRHADAVAEQNYRGGVPWWI